MGREIVIKQIQTMIFKYKKAFIAVTTFILLTLIIGGTFAYYRITKTQNTFNYAGSKCFRLSLEAKSDGINLINQVPKTDEDGLKETGYTFTVKNMCTTYAAYQVNLEDIFDEQFKRLSNKYIKVSLDDGTPKVLSKYAHVSPTVTDADTAFKLTSGSLSPKGEVGDEVTYNLKLWMDYDTPAIDEVMQATFKSKISVIASYIEEENLDNQIEITYVSLNDSYSKDNENVKIMAKSKNYNIIEYSDDGKSYTSINEPGKEVEILKNYTVDSEYKIFVRDEIGNVSNTDIVLDKLDQIGPVIEASVLDEWGSSNDINIFLRDLKSGLSKFSISKSKEIPTTWESISGANTQVKKTVYENGTYYIYAMDNLGNISSSSINVNHIDTYKPVITSLEEGSSYGAVVLLTAKVKDAESGIVGYKFSNTSTIPSEWESINKQTEECTFTYDAKENETVYFYVKDASNNISSKSILVTHVDKSGPVIEASVSSLWASENTITMHIKDTDSGLFGYQITTDNTTPNDWIMVAENDIVSTKKVNENKTYYIWAKDNVGIISRKEVVVANIDVTKPTISVNNDSKWALNANLNITLSDDASGLLGYQITKTETESNDWIILSGHSATINNDSINTNGDYYVWVKDKAGNTNYSKVTINNIDTTIPSINAEVTNKDEWSREKTLKLQFNDEGVGLAGFYVSMQKEEVISWQELSGNNAIKEITLTESGTYYVWCRDSLGNVATKEIEVQKIDRIAPTIVVSLDYGSKSVTINASNSSDNESGIMKYEYSVDGTNYQTSDTSVYTFSNLEEGSYKLYLKVTDNVLNVATYSKDINIYKLQINTKANLNYSSTTILNDTYHKGGVDITWNDYSNSSTFNVYKRKNSNEEWQALKEQITDKNYADESSSDNSSPDKVKLQKMKIVEDNGAANISFEKPSDNGTSYDFKVTEFVYNNQAMGTKTFNYSSSVQSFTAPLTGKYAFDLYGGASASLQKGAKVSGTMVLNKGQTVYILTGGSGNGSNGGSNGGGSGANGGGGATQLTTTNRGNLSVYSNYSSEVIAVAAGAGGDGSWETFSYTNWGDYLDLSARALDKWTNDSTPVKGYGGNSGSNGCQSTNRYGFDFNGYKFAIGANGGSTSGTGGASVRMNSVTGKNSGVTTGQGGGGGSGFPGGGGGSSGSAVGGNNGNKEKRVSGNAGGNGSYGLGGTGGASVWASGDDSNRIGIGSGGGGGAGGTSYVGKLSSSSITDGVSSGNGYATVSLVQDLEGALMAESNTQTQVVTSGIKGYRYIIDDSFTTNIDANNGTFIDTEKINITSDSYGKYLHIAAIDNASNISETTHYYISLNVLAINASVSNTWGKSSTITAYFADDVANLVGYQITDSFDVPESFNELSGNSATINKEVFENGTYYIWGKDAKNNVNYIKIVVDKIDKVLPSAGMKLTDANGSVYVDASMSTDNDSGIMKYEYSLDGNEFYESETSSYVFTNLTNGKHTITLRVTDKAGNESVSSEDISVILKYTITYDLKGGTGDIDSQIKTYDLGLTLSLVIPSKDGYDFLGWSTDLNTLNVNYKSGDIYNENESVTLYAVWKIKTYTIAYNANGGANAPMAQTKEYGKSINIAASTPSRTGYTFKGWSTTENGSVSYNPDSEYNKNENIVLYAIWELQTYSISYNANGGSGAPSGQTKTYGVNVTLSSTKPTRSGYTFLGWSTSSTGGVIYNAGATYTTNANITLYAVWKLNTYYTQAFNFYKVSSSISAGHHHYDPKISYNISGNKVQAIVELFGWAGGTVVAHSSYNYSLAGFTNATFNVTVDSGAKNCTVGFVNGSKVTISDNQTTNVVVPINGLSNDQVYVAREISQNSNHVESYMEWTCTVNSMTLN